MTNALDEAYRLLLAHYGPQHWWPGDTPLEVLVGAVLVQNTAWANVARVMECLKRDALLDARVLLEMPEEELAERIRSSGYYRMKARRLRNVLRLVVEQYGGSLAAMFRQPLADLRSALLAVNGVGPETADSILLYAGGLPTFVVDAYTIRVFTRHGWIELPSTYDEVKALCEQAIRPDVTVYNEFHALLVRVGKSQCTKRTPKCEGCPLAPLLPPDGPRTPFDE